MKSIKYIIQLSLLLACLGGLYSCKKDLSTLDLDKIEGVTVDTTGMGVLQVLQFEKLIVKPDFKSNIPEANLKYEWMLTLAPNDTNKVLLATTRDLDAEISLKPNSTGRYYQLYYRVTDKVNDLQYITTWQLNILNSIGEGLVIAETADGLNSDLSHIMSPLVTSDYNSERVKHGIYSGANGHLIPGLVKQMRFNPEAVALFGITDNSVFRINTIDYTLAGMNERLFFSHSGSFKPDALGGLVQNDVYIENGKFTANYIAVSKQFGLPFDSRFTVPAKVALNGHRTNPKTVLNFYDEVRGQFVYLPSASSFGDRNMYAFKSVSGYAFDPGNVPNKVNVAAGLGVEEEFVHLLRDKSSQELTLYVFNKAGEDYPNIIPSTPKAKFDLSQAPGITEAKHFVINDAQRVLYYSSGNKIYAMLYGSSTPVFQERYAVAAGEEITTLQVYQQSNYPTMEGPFISTNNRQLIISTYDGKEGKVSIIPIKTLGTGVLDPAGTKTYSGFAKITAITSQK